MKKLKKYTRTVFRWWFGFESLRPPEDEDFCSVSTSRNSKSKNSIETLENGMPQRYSYGEIVTFTSNFSHEIGSGEFSNVYKGLFPNGVKVAVKMVKVSRAEAVSKEDFEAKVISFATTYHEHLIKLYGFCSHDTGKAVVYEFMENGSFDRILSQQYSIIKWGKMYGIAIDIGKAFAYFHHGCDNPIIHGNFSTAKVLLDGNFCAKLSLFGISQLTETNDSHHSDGYHSGSSYRSRRGNEKHLYTAPEQWISAEPKTLKSDVYAFGMMLFDILGRIRYSEERKWFPRVVWKKLQNDKLEDILMKCARKKDLNKATILATVACWCIQFTAEARPSMRTVVAVLKKKMHVNMPPEPFTPSKPGISMLPVMDYSQVVDLQQNCNNDKGEATEPLPDIKGRSRLDIHQNTESVEEQLIPDSDGRGEMVSQQNCNSFKEEATDPVSDIHGSRLEIHQNTERLEEQLMPDTDDHGEVDSQQNCNSNQEEATEPVPDINGRSRLKIHQNTEIREEKSMSDTDGDGRGLVDSQQNCDRVKNEAIELVPYINGRSRLDMHQNTERIEEQLIRDTDGRGDAGNERKLEKLLLYVEKKRSITNNVCGSILAKMEELEISCSIIEEERKIKESRRYVEMKQSITDEVCESILKIIKV